MGKALYRKYRSRSLSEIIGQDHITSTLQNALASGKIAHAYLLTGPHGVGKTSIARILAHEINSLPYSDDPHFDIIEIDAASNNGVEDVRELRDKILSAPTSARYKVFIIDEVHMLSRAAFNALLKTLEEPPAHVVFILATTESHKLPATIISRTQRYGFRPVPTQKITAHLREIADAEAIKIDNDALELIAEHGNGTFRDSISLLDQTSSLSDHITRAQVESLLGRAPASEAEVLLNAALSGRHQTALTTFRQLIELGYEPTVIALQLSHRLRKRLTESDETAADRNRTLAFLRSLLDVPASRNPEVLLEIILLDQSSSSQEESSSNEPLEMQPSRRNATELETPSRDKPSKLLSQNSSDTDSTASPRNIRHPDPKTPPQQTAHQDPPVSHHEHPEKSETSTDLSVEELWQSVLGELKKTHNTLYGIARMARPSISGDILLLELSFGFHQKRLNEPRNLAILTSLVERYRDASTQIKFSLITSGQDQSRSSDPVATISNIFGGAELLD